MNKDKLVFISGHFNVIHPGHLRLFRFAKDCGTRLMVGVESDLVAGRTAHILETLRLEGVLCNTYVDEAFIFDEPVEEVIRRIRPDIVVKGKEYESRHNREAEILNTYGGKLLFSSGDSVLSSVDLIHREYTELATTVIKTPEAYFKRNKIDKYRLQLICEEFKKLKVIVIGDLIIDEYITCQPLGMSQEDPTIVVAPIDSQRFIGGAGIVAAHAAGLGAEVTFLTVSGKDSTSEFAIRKLKQFNVVAYLLEDMDRPTTLKQRYRSMNKSLLKVSHLQQRAISVGLQERLIKLAKINLPNADILVFSDFNYGCLPQELIENLTDLAVENDVLLAADSQSSSQVGDISRFRGMNLITPTEREARIAVRNSEAGLAVLAETLRRQAQADNILLKLGEEGLLVHSSGNSDDEVFTDQVPALNSHPKDVAGAGDSLLIVSAMASSCGASIWEAGYLGSLAAAIQVGRVGNTPIQIEELLGELR
jgi:rfaE bifunctional protein kinase chain/domain